MKKAHAKNMKQDLQQKATHRDPEYVLTNICPSYTNSTNRHYVRTLA